MALPAFASVTTSTGSIRKPERSSPRATELATALPGNVGAESLIYLAAADARIQSCRNPIAATGGTDPETNDQIRRRAPQAFLTQERAVTMADYAAMTALNPTGSTSLSVAPMDR